MTLFMHLRHLIPWLLIERNNKLLQDLARWKTIHKLTCADYTAMAILLWRFKEFRNLVLYRNRHHPIRRRLIGLFYPPMDTLYLDALEIGGGLYIQHGFATMIAAKSVGENCWINQQVTVGYNGQSDPPIIGNNVQIACGAKILGNITVGDNSVIGANAVVIRDVEPNATMVGVPAKRIR